MFSFLKDLKLNLEPASETKAEKATVTRIVKAKTTIARESFRVIMPGEKPLTKKQVKAKDAVEIIYDLLKQSKYVDNVKADTLRKLMLYLDEDHTIKSKEKDLIEWLKADAGIKIVKKIKVTVTK